jgi:nucleotide-binding universal stress UspA family protein
MSDQNREPVVVAVGHDPMDAALTYAAGEAVRAGSGLHLVHVAHHLAQGPEMPLVDSVDLEHVARQTLRAVEERARDLLPSEVPVTTELLWGTPVPSLVKASARARARVIVLQRRPLSRVVRIVTRSISSGVAARAEVPVVSVPARWTPTGSSGDVQTVTVGVDVAERSEDVLRVALDAARRRGAHLRVLHAWSLPTAYSDIIMSRTEAAEWEERATREIRDVLDRLADEAANTSIEIEMRNGYPSDALVEAGRTSELLVIGRHDSMVPFGSHLGPVARALLQEATCPVLLAHPRPRHHWRTERHQATAT